MCDIESERGRIDALLDAAARAAPAGVREDERALARFCLAALGEHYATECPDECLRRRCDDFVARIMRGDVIAQENA
ncbi:hypothetical protein [Methylosinus sporium]|uniref:hypothetical protein n=1 Tax=Methylosinus sporium TaxID=428 RepID=UPI00383B72E6